MIQSLTTDFLIRIKNGSLARRKTITVPGSRYSLAIANLMKKYGYLNEVEIIDDLKKTMKLTLAYHDRAPVVSEVKLFSRPGQRQFANNISLPWGKTPSSLIIVSTSRGVMSQKEAKSKGLGGELVAEIY